MALIESYLVTDKNLTNIFTAIQGGQAPERFTNKFLDQLGFSSSNDRLYLKLLRDLGFIDETGVPTQRYYDFLDSSQSANVLGLAVKEAYSDLFVINKRAWSLNRNEIKNKLKTLTQGKKSPKVIALMAMTFEALCKYVNFDELKEPLPTDKGEDKKPLEDANDNTTQDSSPKKHSVRPELHYTIQIHLPESRDPKVFDAIFDNLRKHLL